MEWKINWYVCREGERELWRVAQSIGPIAPDHNHWAGWYVADEADAKLAAAAPKLLKACKIALQFTEADWDAPSMNTTLETLQTAIKLAEGTN